MVRPPGKRCHRSCLRSALSAILALILADLPLVHTIELRTLDARFRQLPHLERPETDRYTLWTRARI